MIKILTEENEIKNYTNEELVRMGFALSGDALMAFNDRAGQPKLEAVIDDLESDLHLCQEEKEELQSRIEELEDEIADLKEQLK